MKVEEFTKNLCDYFSPEIEWEHCTFEFKNLSFGVIYTYPPRTKPSICKKIYDAQNTKYSLKEGDIYYRYGGRSERIHYEELNAIMEDVCKAEEAQWLSFIKNASKILRSESERLFTSSKMHSMLPMVMFSWHDQYRSGFRKASYIQMYKIRKTLGAQLIVAY